VKVLFVSHKFPPSVGGMETHNYELYKFLETRIAIVPIIIHPHDNKLAFYLSLRTKVKAALTQNPDINLFYINDGLLAIILADLSMHFPKVKFVATIHGLEISFPLRFYQSKLIPRLNHLDHLICVSSHTTDILKSLLIDNSKISTIKNGCDVNEIPKLENAKEFEKKYQFLKGARVVVSLGRAIKRKGFSWFANHVMPTIDDNVYYLVVGPQAKESVYLKTIKSLLPKSLVHKYHLAIGFPEDTQTLKENTNPRVVILGKLPQQELDFVIHRADLAIVPNIEVAGDIEGFGLVALELAVKEKLVLVANIQGLKDAIIDQHNGIMIESGNAHLWSETIKEWLNKPNEAYQFGKKARIFTQQNYSWQKMGQAYLDTFYQISQ
jgi:glycosyltransferase involved in cell wall biosynthesis